MLPVLRIALNAQTAENDELTTEKSDDVKLNNSTNMAQDQHGQAHWHNTLLLIACYYF